MGMFGGRLELMIRNVLLDVRRKKDRPELIPAGIGICSLNCNGLRKLHLFTKPLATFNLWHLAAIELQHEQPKRRRKIALLTLCIDAFNKHRQGHSAPAWALSLADLQYFWTAGAQAARSSGVPCCCD